MYAGNHGDVGRGESAVVRRGQTCRCDVTGGIGGVGLIRALAVSWMTASSSRPRCDPSGGPAHPRPRVRACSLRRQPPGRWLRLLAVTFSPACRGGDPQRIHKSPPLIMPPPSRLHPLRRQPPPFLGTPCPPPTHNVRTPPPSPSKSPTHRIPVQYRAPCLRAHQKHALRLF